MATKPSKLKKILLKRRLSQVEFLNLIKSKYPEAKTGASMINKIVKGKHPNYTIKTALIISKTLNVEIKEIIDDEEIIENSID